MAVPPEFIAGVTGSAISFIAGRFPRLNVAYAKLSSDAKSWIMIGATVVTATGIFFWECRGPVSACIDGLDIRTWLQTVGAAIVLNATTHHILPEAPEVKAAKVEAKEKETVSEAIEGVSR